MATACQTKVDYSELWEPFVEDAAGSPSACQLVKLACARHERDLARAGSDGFPYRFDLEAANDAIDFFCSLVLTKGLERPRPFRPEPWEAFIVASLFGWLRADSGLRRFRSAHIMVARKNGKSHLMAGIGLYGLIADGEAGAEVYSIATKKDQARFIWDAASEFRRCSGDLADYVKKSASGCSLYVPETASKFQALSSDEDGLDGLNVHIGLIDELQNHPTDIVYGRIDTSTGARRQPLIISIATAGIDRHSVCWRMHEYAAHVLQGEFTDEAFFGFIAEADEGDDWESENTWKKANPNLGVSVNIEDLRRKAGVAKQQPSALNDFLRLHLNKWTSQDKAWMPMDRWRACGGHLLGENDVTLTATHRPMVEDVLVKQGRRPVAGLDLSERHDITALVLLFPPTASDPKWIPLCYYFVPQDGVEKRVKQDRVPYDVWIREGRIIATPGSVVDYDYVREEVIRLHRKLHFRGLAVDPHNALQLNNQLRGEGVPVIEVQQGWKSLSNPTKELMAWALERKMNHLDDPILSWMASNVSVWRDAQGNIKPDKQKSRERIDGISALVNAMFLALKQGPAKTPHIFSLDVSTGEVHDVGPAAQPKPEEPPRSVPQASPLGGDDLRAAMAEYAAAHGGKVRVKVFSTGHIRELELPAALSLIFDLKGAEFLP